MANSASAADAPISGIVFGGAGYRRETESDRPQLQRDIGNGAEQQDDRRQRRDHPALVEARPDEVGYGGSAIAMQFDMQAMQEAPPNAINSAGSG